MSSENTPLTEVTPSQTDKSISTIGTHINDDDQVKFGPTSVSLEMNPETEAEDVAFLPQSDNAKITPSKGNGGR